MHRSRLHILLGVLLWVVFGYYWYIVVRRPITAHTQLALLIVGSIVVSVTLIMFGWVLHNTRLSRRNRRFERSDAPPGPESDFLGRTFTATDGQQIKSAAYIEVHLVESPDGESAGHKVFRVPGKIPDQS